MPQILFSRRWLPITLLVLIASALCVRLGVWQLDRLEQRRASNAKIIQITSLPAASLPTSDDLAAQEFRSVHAQGTYDYDRQVALRNQVHRGEYGFHLLTPLFLQNAQHEDTGSAILVDRGWISAEGNRQPEDWRKYDVPGVVSVTGVIRRGSEMRTPAVAASLASTPDASTDRFALAVNTAELSNQLGYALPSYYVQAGGSDPDALPAAESPVLDLSDGPHLGYAVQWFGFSIILLGGYARYVSKQEQGKS